MCNSGRCRDSGVSLHSRCRQDGNCTGHDSNSNPVSCQYGFCLRHNHNFYSGDGKKIECKADWDCRDQDKYCYQNKCKTYVKGLNEACNMTTKKCGHDLTCFSGKCMERCDLNHDDDDDSGCTTSDYRCRRVEGVSWHRVCIPKTSNKYIKKDKKDTSIKKNEPVEVDDSNDNKQDPPVAIKPNSKSSEESGEESFYEEHKVLIWSSGTALFVLLIAGIVAFFVVKRSRKH